MWNKCWSICMRYCIGRCKDNLRRTFYWVNLSYILVDQGLEACDKCWKSVVYYCWPSYTSVTPGDTSCLPPPHQKVTIQQTPSTHRILDLTHWNHPYRHHNNFHINHCVFYPGWLLCNRQCKAMRIEQKYIQ